jgi:hypothetical protein
MDAIKTGKDYQGSLYAFASSMAAQGGHESMIVDFARYAMEQVTDRDVLWQSCYDDIPRITRSTLENHAPPPKEWPEVEPLGADFTEAKPFPVEALTPVIGAAVSEFRAYGKQPLGLIASSALASASVACQGRADVARDSALVGPISLFVLPIGESGERKSAIDNAFGKELRNWEEEQQRQAADAIKAAKGKHRAWNAKIRAVERVVGELESGKIPPQLGKGNDPSALQALTAEWEKKLEQLTAEEPLIPGEPKLLFGDTTIEALAQDLQHGLPIGALWEDEGGAVLGSVGLSNDRLLGFVTGINKLWEAKPLSQSRVSVDSRNTRGKRVSVNLMIQPAILAKLATLVGGTARNVGFLARVLLCEPATTMGTRDYTPPGTLEAVNRFNQRVAELLRKPFPFREGSSTELDPPVLKLSPAAYEVWQEYYRHVEKHLSPDGDLHEIRDFASKNAEQAARIAGVFHVFEVLPDTGDLEISADTMQRAATIAAWFLHDTLRVFNLRDLPEHIQDGIALLKWMKGQGEAQFSTTDIIHKASPRVIRTDKARRDRALDALCNHGWLVLEKQGKAKTFHLNPATPGE